MKEIVIYGDNRQETATRTRIACRGVLIRDGNILLVHEANLDKYLIPGGGLEEGETPEQCCIREMAEETGTVVKPRQHYLTIHEYYERWHLISHYFWCELQGTTEQRLTDYEADVGMVPKWMPLDEARKMFGAYTQGAGEMTRGAYLREYTALQALPEQD